MRVDHSVLSGAAALARIAAGEITNLTEAATNGASSTSADARHEPRM